MVTSNGTRAFGIDANMLMVGKKVNVIVLNLKKNMIFTPLLNSPSEERRGI
jgi:5-methylthioadenosine/S-adenosylhomocysteine deaminase